MISPISKLPLAAGVCLGLAGQVLAQPDTDVFV